VPTCASAVNPRRLYRQAVTGRATLSNGTLYKQLHQTQTICQNINVPNITKIIKKHKKAISLKPVDLH
jgi:hypothetical protein